MSNRTLQNGRWPRVTPERCCPKCSKPDRCTLAADGRAGHCFRSGETWREDRGGGGGDPIAMRRPGRGKAATSKLDWSVEGSRLRESCPADRITLLADSTGVPATAWAKLGPGWADSTDLKRFRAGGAGWADSRPDGAFVFVEHCGDGRVVGLSLRAADGRKGSPSGSGRGIVIPDNLHDLPDPVLIVEGASDVAACAAMGLTAVGRPSNRGGADDLAVLLDGREVLVIGERDGKASGSWPGRDGAKAVAARLSGRWNESVRWSLPPLGSKDVREWWKARVAAGLIPADSAACAVAGHELLEAFKGKAKAAKAERRSQADALVALAQEQHELGMSDDGDAFAVPRDGPAVALLFRGGKQSLRLALAKSYQRQTGRAPSASGLSDALTTLEGIANECPAEPVALRIGEHDGSIVLDLGDPTGRVAVASAAGWSIVEVSPVLFRRTVLTACLPEPVPAEPVDLLQLRTILNVGNEAWPVLVGWLVACLIPKIPHPILMLGGEQGTGKSSAARTIIGLFDPSPAQLRSEPRDAEQWAVAASGSWSVCLDNVSTVSGWLSDALCKAVTGDGMVRRKLYTDSDLAIIAFRRCLLLTSIDTGSLRGDLADRLLMADLERIPDEQRRTEAELAETYEAMRPMLLGALLTATSRVLAALPGVKLASMPRMADFARVLAALDAACPEVTGGRALELFTGQRRRLAGDVVESDGVASAIVKLLESRTHWSGSAGEMLSELTPSPVPKNWPASGRALVGKLKRLRPALSAVGIDHVPPAETDKTRTHRLEKSGERPPESPTPPSMQTSMDDADGRSSGGTALLPADHPLNRPSENGIFTQPAGLVGRSGGMGGTSSSTSAADTDDYEPNERAAIHEFDAGLPRSQAEQLALKP